MDHRSVRRPATSAASLTRAAVVALLFLCGLGAAWAGLARLLPSAGQVRAALYDDVENGRLERCEVGLAWLSKHDRLTPQDLVALARVARARGRLDEALEALGAVPDGSDLAAAARFQAGRIEMSLSRMHAAEAALKAALAIDPRLAPARLELIRIYARQQRLADLDAQFEALAGQGALDFTYLSFWAMTRNLRWEPEADLDALRKAVEADPMDRESRLALGEGLRRVGKGAEAGPIVEPLPAGDPDARSLRAALALDRSDLDEAAALIAEGPDSHAETARLRGLLALSRHDPAAAADWFRAALAARPDDRRALNSLGVALKLTGRDDEAARRLESAARYDALAALTARLTEPTSATDADLHRKMGAASEAVGRRTDAREWYRLAIALNPLDSESQHGLYRLAKPVGAGREP
jgi:tetratricopeptide (TPR) repeat protein